MSPRKELKILVASGVNLDLLGTREPDIYGSTKLTDLHHSLSQLASKLETLSSVKLNMTFFQSNDEAEFLEVLSQEIWDGAILNPGAWTHTSLALADRLVGLALPFVEVHISNTSAREEHRSKSFTAPHALGVCYGFGVESYHTGLFGLVNNLLKRP